MGTVFQVPWTRIGDSADDWPTAGIEELHRLGFEVASFALSNEAISLDDPQFAACEKLAMVFCTEGEGLSHEVDRGVRLHRMHSYGKRRRLA